MKKILLFVLFLGPLSINAQHDVFHECAVHESVEKCVEKKPPSLLLPRLYPNPATDILNIENLSSDDRDGNIFDTVGRFYQKVQLHKSLNISDLPQGAYIIRTKYHALKFVKI